MDQGKNQGSHYLGLIFLHYLCDCLLSTFPHALKLQGFFTLAGRSMIYFWLCVRHGDCSLRSFQVMFPLTKVAFLHEWTYLYSAEDSGENLHRSWTSLPVQVYLFSLGFCAEDPRLPTLSLQIRESARFLSSPSLHWGLGKYYQAMIWSHLGLTLCVISQA